MNNKIMITIYGIILCVLTSLLAIIFSNYTGTILFGFEKSPFSPIIFSIIIGILLSNSIEKLNKFNSGFKFCIKYILKTGIILLGISFLIFVSLLSYSVEDPGFGAVNSNNIKNWLGLYGSYTASFLIVFIDISSYLLVVFFFISGLKLILGINFLIYLKVLILAGPPRLLCK